MVGGTGIPTGGGHLMSQRCGADWPHSRTGPVLQEIVYGTDAYSVAPIHAPFDDIMIHHAKVN